MPEEITTGGAAGAPAATPEAAGSQSLADEVLKTVSSAELPKEPAPAAKTTFSEDLLKQLETVNPEELPQSLREKLEKPFLSQYGKKTTAWDQERQSYLTLIDNLAKKLESGSGITADTKSKVSDLLANGDYEGATAAMRDELRQEITPERQYVSTMVAINEAKNLMPDLGKYEGLVAERLTADPVLSEMASIGNRRYAGRILAGLAFQAENQVLKTQLAEAQKTFETRVKMAVEETQRRIRGLPSSTSRAGSTPTADSAAKPMGLSEAMEAAWREQAGG